jgi:hypothetical protein
MLCERRVVTASLIEGERGFPRCAVRLSESGMQRCGGFVPAGGAHVCVDCMQPGPARALDGHWNYFQSQRQNPPRPRARPSVTFLVRRAMRRGLPLAIALMLFEIRAAR